MTTLTVNLLSPEKQREGLFRFLLYRTKMILEVALFLTLCVAIAVIGIKIFLVNTVLTYTTTSNVNVSMRALEQSVRTINQRLALLNNAQGEYTPWSPSLAVISNAIPSAIRLHTLIVDRTAKQPRFKLQGRAATRNDLLTFKKTLEKLPFAKNLSFPIENLLAREESEWQVEFDFVPNQ